ncbi:MAG: hypothetical protein IJD97_05280, partial [Clostridia bacterium]|nr:hypothetical protein [Clostridia bacterium]
RSNQRRFSPLLGQGLSAEKSYSMIFHASTDGPPRQIKVRLTPFSLKAKTLVHFLALPFPKKP